MGKIKTFIIEQEEQCNLTPMYGDNLDDDWSNFEGVSDESE